MTWRRLLRGELSWDIFRGRAAILEGIRSFFRARGFLEVDPPAAVPCPNVDPNVFPLQVAGPDGRGARFFLHTSPELSMKKLLAAGSGNIFFLGKVFRDREGSPLHAFEFTMLEWYRVGEPPEAVMRDVEDLVLFLSRRAGGGEALRRGERTIPLRAPWPRLELGTLFAELLGAAPGDAAALRQALAARGFRPAAGETGDDLFFRACVDVIEPALRRRGACFVTGFPARFAPMARRRPDDPQTAERFEGYVDGIELVNGYEELTDPDEQEERLRDAARRHGRETGVDLPLDADFLDALRAGLPPCSGAALGVDRLVMLLLGLDDIADAAYR